MSYVCVDLRNHHVKHTSLILRHQPASDKDPNSKAADVNDANRRLCNAHLNSPFKMSENTQINKE